MLHRFPIRALIPWNNQTCLDIRPMSGLCRYGYWSIAMKRTGILVTACVLLAAPAWAQSTTTGVGSAPATEEFVKKVAISNMFEVQASQVALDKKPDADTKPFARKMVTDHTATTKQLKSLVESGKVKVTLPTALDADHQKKLDELRGLDGKQFDQAYDQAQLQGHEEAVQLFEQYSRSGDNPDLKRWAAKTLPHLKQHLAMARKLK